MKKVLAMMMAVVIMVSMFVVPASAATTMKWNWGAAQKSINSAISQIVQKEQTETEPTEHVVDVEEANVVADTQTYSWNNWMSQWSLWLQNNK